MPEWNQSPGGSPPSVDDVLEKIQLKLKGFKGGPVLILVAVVVVFIIGWTSWFTVQPEETGIVQRFGKVMRTAGPGLHFKLPFGIEKVRLLPTARVLKEEFGFRTLATVPGEKTRYAQSGSYKDESLMLTGDLNVIDVQWIIQYRIEDPIRYLFQVRNTPKTIRDTSEAIMRRAVGNRLGSDVLTTGRVAIASEAKIEIQKVLTDYESGVRLVTVELQDVTPPDTVKPAFNEVNESRQDKERTINKAQEQANREIPKARGVATQSISEAEGYALERVNRAEGEATRFEAILGEYQGAPQVTRRRLYLEAMTGLLADMKGLYIVDRDQKAMVPWLPREATMKFTLKTAIIGIAVVILIVIYSGLYTLEEGLQAIVVQFGRPVGEPVTEAGLHIKLPFVQEVRRFEKRLLVWDGDPNQIPTKGREFIWVDTTARWRIADAKKFLENVASEAGAQNRLNDIIDSVVRDQVSSSELVELVRSASWEVPKEEALKDIPKEREEELKKEIARGREEITRTILREAQKIIPQYGIELVDVRIKRLDYVESVREKVYERMISERKRIAAQFRSEGEGRSAEILGTMEKELRQIRSTAYRRVQEIQGQADADATRIYGQAYNRNPEFYAFLRTLESYKEKTNKNSVLILTTDSDFYQYIKQASPGETLSLEAPVSPGTMP